MSDSLTAIYIEPHQCPWHQSILLTFGINPRINPWFFQKKYWELAELNFLFFLNYLFFQKKIISSPWKSVKVASVAIWWLPWFTAKDLLCLIICYTVRNEYFNFVKLKEFENWKKHMCCWGKWPWFLKYVWEIARLRAAFFYQIKMQWNSSQSKLHTAFPYYLQ